MESRPDRIYFNSPPNQDIELKPVKVNLKGDGKAYKRNFYWKIFWKRALETNFFSDIEWPVLLYYASWIFFCLGKHRFYGIIILCIFSLVSWSLWVIFVLISAEELFPSDHLFVTATFQAIKTGS